jgi:hypothetical protein
MSKPKDWSDFSGDDLNDEGELLEDMGDSPGVFWGGNTPYGVVSSLEDGRTTQLRTTQLFFELGHVGEDANYFLVKFCQEDHHVHVMLNQTSPIAQCSVAVALSYTLALALDRSDWVYEQDTIDMNFAWGEVLEVLKEAHPTFAEYLAERAVEGGVLGDPTSWAVQFFSDLESALAAVKPPPTSQDLN